MSLFEQNYLSYPEAIKITTKPGYESDWKDQNETLYELRYTTNDGQPIDLEIFEFPSVLRQEFDESSNQYVVKLKSNIIDIELFSSCPTLTTVIIGEGITNIGDYAFYNCKNLVSVIIPNSITKIGGYVFEECSNLISIEIPNKVKRIETYTFYNCSSLTSVTIPNSITHIGSFAFGGCNSLTFIILPDTITQIGNYAFNGVDTVIYSGTAIGSPWGANRVITENN